MSANEKPIQATFDGEQIEAPAGASIAAALIASDRIAWRDTRDGAKRGLFCGIGVCFDCLVEVNGESGQRACMIPLQQGMRVCAAKSPRAEHDHAATGADQHATDSQPNDQHASNEGAAK